MSDYLLRVGKRGEIYTSKEVRERVGIKAGGLVRATVKRGRLVIEPVPTVEELLGDVVVEITPEEAERLSEEVQREEGVYG